MSEIEYITARTYDECISKLQSLYGNNFQPIKKRYVNRGGVFGFFQHEAVQVSYVVTEQIPSIFSVPNIRREPEKDFDREKEKILGLTRNPNGTYSQTVIPEENKPVEKTEDDSYQKLLDEMKSLRADVAGIKVNGAVEEEPESIVKIRTTLENNDFSPAYIRQIIERIRKTFSLKDLENYEEVKKAVLAWIEETISIDDVDEKEKPQIIILVGPTGVGKTTTVAKLAAKYAPAKKTFTKQQKVHILTIDNYRIAGKDQIEKYGEIMGITVDGCNNADDIAEKMQQFGPESETILIDTIGFSPRDCDGITKMKSILSIQGYRTVVYLAMMASTKANDMREIMKQYELFGYDDVIVTKLDETSCIGNLISIVSEKGKKFAYYTTGQRVPADIEKASVGKLTGMLHGLELQINQQEQMFPAEYMN